MNCKEMKSRYFWAPLECAWRGLGQNGKCRESSQLHGETKFRWIFVWIMMSYIFLASTPHVVTCEWFIILWGVCGLGSASLKFFVLNVGKASCPCPEWRCSKVQLPCVWEGAHGGTRGGEKVVLHCTWSGAHLHMRWNMNKFDWLGRSCHEVEGLEPSILHDNFSSTFFSKAHLKCWTLVP